MPMTQQAWDLASPDDNIQALVGLTDWRWKRNQVFKLWEAAKQARVYLEITAVDKGLLRTTHFVVVSGTKLRVEEFFEVFDVPVKGLMPR